jgi:hypothetical protein
LPVAKGRLVGGTSVGRGIVVIFSGSWIGSMRVLLKECGPFLDKIDKLV